MSTLHQLIYAARNVQRHIDDLREQLAEITTQVEQLCPVPIGSLGETHQGRPIVADNIEVRFSAMGAMFEVTGPLIGADGNPHPTYRGRQLIPIDRTDER